MDSTDITAAARGQGGTHRERKERALSSGDARHMDSSYIKRSICSVIRLVALQTHKCIEGDCYDDMFLGRVR